MPHRSRSCGSTIIASNKLGPVWGKRHEVQQQAGAGNRSGRPGRARSDPRQPARGNARALRYRSGSAAGLARPDGFHRAVPVPQVPVLLPRRAPGGRRKHARRSGREPGHVDPAPDHRHGHHGGLFAHQLRGGPAPVRPREKAQRAERRGHQGAVLRHRERQPHLRAEGALPELRPQSRRRERLYAPDVRRGARRLEDGGAAAQERRGRQHGQRGRRYGDRARPAHRLAGVRRHPEEGARRPGDARAGRADPAGEAGLMPSGNKMCRGLERRELRPACAAQDALPKSLQETPMSKKKFAVVLAVCAAATMLGFEGGRLIPVSSSQAQTPQVQRSAASALPDFSALVEQNGPAVVNISTTAAPVRTQMQLPQIPGEPGDPIQEFFRRFQIPMPQGDAIRRGVGSGFIVSADGYILTNAHVVDDASEVTVKLTDKREFKAKVIGVDRRTDVALVKIDSKNLPTVRIGDASKARVGEWVAAIGSPFGLENTVTAGIISAKSRSLPDETYVPFIQTDVAINPGNSGGPLFNMAGEVIGINSQIYSRTGGYMGLSFAVPIDVAMKVKTDLQKYGKVSRGRLGVTIQGVTQELADSFGLKKAQGALVSAVEPKSPADKAGIKTGDIILAVDGRAIENSVDLPRAIGESRPRTAVTLKAWRQGETQELRASLGEAPAEKVARADSESKTQPSKLGLAVRPLTEEERKQIEAEGGLLVEQSEGPAARAGVQAGDVILALNNQPVKSVDQLRRLVDRSRGSVALLIQREGNKIYVPIRLG